MALNVVLSATIKFKKRPQPDLSSLTIDDSFFLIPCQHSDYLERQPFRALHIFLTSKSKQTRHGYQRQDHFKKNLIK